ncbi:tellurite resistance TerB family protein [Plastoroseomonas arctica]|uniref:Co-chaperone DjlA N-terminal domain-containing protein n=1 Tax=Plastoroseomonas arctica TaxID=1509237 RepID=A0AAF1KRB7_9PROT|nr:hypothetical protein [Plastoroseomonas arctica]MBR0654102.1 hypothetical protein [Plastoroseomonas arctica]
MGGHILGEREKALEDAFFARHNQALVQKLRDEDQAKTRRAAIAAASGITDEALLDKLAEMKIGPEMLAAIAYVPLVLIAWADGSLDAREREAVLAGAKEGGLDEHPEARGLLDAWLAAPPPPSLLVAWRGYVQAIAATMSVTERDSLRREILGRARRVAEATGGFLGLGGKVSAAEEAVLANLDTAFVGAA